MNFACPITSFHIFGRLDQQTSFHMLQQMKKNIASMVEFSLGDEVLVHMEDGLIYLGVLVEVEEDGRRGLIRFGE